MNGTDIAEILDLNRLLILMVLAIGVALVAGNGFAIWQNHLGKKPKGEAGEFRPGRAYWLFGVGIVMAIWTLISL